MKQAVGAAAIVVVGGGILAGFVATRPKSERKTAEAPRLLVETLTLEQRDHIARLPAQGAVVAANQVDLKSEVGGRVVWQSPTLVPGGQFKKGDALLRIDPRDHQTSVEQQRAQLDRARLDLELERGRKEVAEREWQILRSDADGEEPASKALALREPHLQAAKVGMEAAESGLRRAKLNLERTTIRAPFNGFVKDEAVDPGQLLSPGIRLGTLVGTDEFWVQVSVPADWLSAIRLPRDGKGGSTAKIRQTIGGEVLERDGEVVRLFGDVDPVGRMARLLVAVEDPFSLKKDDNTLPLLLGSYVDVEIEGVSIEGAIEVPRQALRDGDRVYVYTSDSKLATRPVQVVRRQAQSVLVKSGVEDGERIITSRVPTAIEGMGLRTRDDDPAPAAEVEKVAAGEPDETEPKEVQQ